MQIDSDSLTQIEERTEGSRNDMRKERLKEGRAEGGRTVGRDGGTVDEGRERQRKQERESE